MESPFNLHTLTLDKDYATTTIFSNGKNPLKMREHASHLKVVGFIQNNMGISLQGNPRYEWLSSVKTELDMVKNYYQNFDRGANCFKTAHSLTKLKWGRTMPANNLSLNVMHRPTRHAFCEGIYVDVDMVNAHVSILCEIFKHHENIDISALRVYNSAPKKWREELALHHGLDPVKRKDDTKQLFIRILFGGSYQQWIKDFDVCVNIEPEQRHPLVLSIENQLGSVREAFFRANPQLQRDMVKHDKVKFKDINQLKRSLLANALQTIERWIMEESVGFLVKEKGFDIHDIVPCQDGFMFKRHLYYEGCERDFEMVTSRKFGLNISWISKEFDEAIHIPDGIVSRDFDSWLQLLSDTGLANEILSMHGNKIRYKRPTEDSKDLLYVFDAAKKRWYLEDTKKPPTLNNLIGQCYDSIKNAVDDDKALKEEERSLFVRKLINSLQNTGGINNVLRKLLDLAEWCDCGFDSVPYYLGFENGFIDLRTKEFQEYREDVFITITTGYNYRFPDFENSEADILAREQLIGIFDGMFEKVEDSLYYLQIMASGLDAINYQYIWFFEGAGGNGKGLGLALNNEVLGSRLFKPAHGGILTADGDKANQTSENIIALKDARMAVFNEMDKTEGMTWSSLKLLTGGDPISARRLYQGLITFFLTASFIGAFNSKPDMVGHVVGPERASLERRLKPLHFPFLFTEDEDKIAKGGNFKRANTLFVDTLWRKSVRDVYLDLLLGVYMQYYDSEKGCLAFTEPASIKEACREYLRGEDLFLEIFEDLYMKDASRADDRKEHRLYIGDLYEAVKRHQLFRDGSEGKGKKQFQRTWNKKAFIGWCYGKFEVVEDTHVRRDYILGHVLQEDYREPVEDIIEECECI